MVTEGIGPESAPLPTTECGTESPPCSPTECDPESPPFYPTGCGPVSPPLSVLRRVPDQNGFSEIDDDEYHLKRHAVMVLLFGMNPCWSAGVHSDFRVVLMMSTDLVIVFDAVLI